MPSAEGWPVVWLKSDLLALNQERRRHVSSCEVGRYLKTEVRQVEEHTFRQTKRGPPGPTTTSIRTTTKRWMVDWSIDQETVDDDRKSDRMYPLLTNDGELLDAEVFAAHKRQPTIEKRF